MPTSNKIERESTDLFHAKLKAIIHICKQIIT